MPDPDKPRTSLTRDFPLGRISRQAQVGASSWVQSQQGCEFAARKIEELGFIEDLAHANFETTASMFARRLRNRDVHTDLRERCCGFCSWQPSFKDQVPEDQSKQS